MTGKRVGGWLALTLSGLALLGGIVLAGTAAVVGAHDEKGQRDERWVFFPGHARLGVQIADVTAERARELQLPGEYGAVIEEVEADSPAAQAGLQANDVILGLADERVRSAAQLRRLVGETPPGRKLTLQVSRAGQVRSVEVTLEERRVHILPPRIRIPEIALPGIRFPEFDFRIYSHRSRLGISGDELTPQLAEYFGVKQGKGVLVREVLAGRPAAQAGLKAGDVIVRVDAEEVGSVAELRRVLAGDRESQQVTLTIVRDRREQTLKVELEKPKDSSPRRAARAEGEDAPERLEPLAAEIEAEAKQWEQEMRRWEQDSRREQLQWQKEWEQEQRDLQRKLRPLERELRTVEVI